MLKSQFEELEETTHIISIDCLQLESVLNWLLQFVGFFNMKILPILRNKYHVVLLMKIQKRKISNKISLIGYSLDTTCLSFYFFYKIFFFFFFYFFESTNVRLLESSNLLI